MDGLGIFCNIVNLINQTLFFTSDMNFVESDHIDEVQDTVLAEKRNIIGLIFQFGWHFFTLRS